MRERRATGLRFPACAASLGHARHVYALWSPPDVPSLGRATEIDGLNTRLT